MEKWVWSLLCLLCLAVSIAAQGRRGRRGGGGGSSSGGSSAGGGSWDDDDDDDDDEVETIFWANVGGIVVICILSVVGAAAFSLCAWIACSCHERCRKDKVRHSPRDKPGPITSVAPEWTSALRIQPEFLHKGFSVMSDGFFSLNICHLVRQRPGTAITDGARWDVPMTSGKHLFEIIWPWGCRGGHATVGVGTKDAPIKGKGGVNLVGNNCHSWGLDIVRRRAIHNKTTIRACPTDGSYVPDRFLMYVDLDMGRLGFGCDVTFWGFVLNSLPTNGEKPFYVMVGADKWQAQIQVYYRGSAAPNGLGDMYTPNRAFHLPPISGPMAPQPLHLPTYSDALAQPAPIKPNACDIFTVSNDMKNTNNDDDHDWKPQPPPTPSPTAPDDHDVMYEPPPPYASPPPEY